jgi:hypothetical protein
MSETKQFTASDALSIIEFSKDFDYKDVDSETILLDWKLRKSNTISEADEHGLSVVGIYEHPIILKDKEVGKIILFNYTGVGGGWHNDIYKMVQEKYFGKGEYYSFIDNGSYYRLFFVGNGVFDTNKWEKYKNNSKIRIHTEKLGKGLLKILYDMDSSGKAGELVDTLRDYEFFYDFNSAVRIYVKSIEELKFKPARPIIEKRIKERKK